MRKALLAALVLLFVVGVTHPADAVELTPEQEERFVAGAVALGTFASRAEAKAFLIEHPEKVLGVGIGYGSSADGIGLDVATKTQQWEVWLNNLLGQRIWTWYFKRTWSYNGVKVTGASSQLWPTITELGKSFQWQYDGVIDTSKAWRNCSGEHWRSCRYTWYLGKFSSPLIGASEYPWQAAEVRYNGTWGWSYGR